MKLTLDKISVHFRKKEALHEVTLMLTPGIYGIVGENGAGKTTLFRCMLGVQKYKGNIFLEDIQDIGYVPQNFECMAGLKVEEILHYFCCLKGIAKKGQEACVKEVLELVNLSQEKDKKVKALSGGMLRRLGIAQALLGEPQLLIMDEPTVGLDPAERVNLRSIIEKISADRIVLISSHEIREIEHICERIVFLHQGRCIREDSISHLIHAYGTDDLEEIYFRIMQGR